MKKMISQLCTASILLGSLNVSAYASQNTVRDVLAQYSSSVERGESQIKSLSEAALALKEQNVSTQEMVDFITSDMSPAEAASYRANVLPGLAQADSENVGVLFKQATASMGVGANFRGCNNYYPGVVTWVAGGTAIYFLVQALNNNDISKRKKNDIKDMRLKKTDMESDISIYIGEGVKPESFLIASIKKDISFLDEQMAQAQQESDEAKAKAPKFAAAAAAAGLVTAVGATTNCF